MCGLALGCLSLRWCRIPPDLTQECVLGDDEGRIWYWPLEIVDIPSPGGTKRHFCFLWSPSSGINAASCNLSLEPSKTLRHLMTLQGRLSSPWRQGEMGGGGGVFKSWATVLYTYIYLQLVEVNLTHNLCEAISGKKTAIERTLDSAVFIQVQSIFTVLLRCLKRCSAEGQRPTEKSLCLQLGGGDFNTGTALENHGCLICRLYQQTTRNSGTNGSVMRDEK